MFVQLSADKTGIHFKNEITETDSINPMKVVNVYNGGGVGIGDFNKDGLQDIFFTGNMVPSKLYLNKGDFKFEDVTTTAGVDGQGKWARGVAVVDINNDGLPDLYIANTIYADAAKRTNILYVNKGADKSGVPHFADEAAAYGLALQEQSTMANFFDYDNDGDLDMYLTVNEAASVDENKFGKRGTDGRKANLGGRGKLFQNNWDSALGHAVYKDVSDSAGLTLEGFGHGATTADINQDGWKDIYVSNDFLSDNILYINNHDGTFTSKSKAYFKHTAFNAMGQDVVDINNDGRPDVVELDMNPKDNFRKKMMLGTNNYNTFQNFDLFGTQHQYVRNTLQINQGRSIGENDSIGDPVFSEVGFVSGIAQTDWSWTPLVQDFDNDGLRDMIVTNGFPKDVTDHDFIMYRQHTVAGESPLKMLDKIPEVKLLNFAFKNTNGLMFNDVTNDWGLTAPSFSNGAAYADLDNDGDLDMVVNNIDDEAFVYQNTVQSPANQSTHYLQVQLEGGAHNIDGLGATVTIFYNHGQQQTAEHTPYRGYLSTHQAMVHFGLGAVNNIDSLVVQWPEGRRQMLTNIPADKVITLKLKDATETAVWTPERMLQPALFKEVTHAMDADYNFYERDIIDFNVQGTLPHKLSEYRPALSVADLDGNGYDDLVIGGNSFSYPRLFLQQPGGQFQQQDIIDPTRINKQSNDEGILLFDANGDGAVDMYIASGGYNFEPNTASYQDVLFVNDGKGHFTKDSTALPVNHTSKQCVKAMDFNGDGKLDLFVSGRVEPWKYPKPVSSFLFRNDSKDGKAKFTDVTKEIAPALLNIGMVCDALFTDFDNDGAADLLLAGEWMPLTFLKNEKSHFRDVSATSGVANQPGWWNSIVAGDFRHTGRTDYIIGNVGLNTLYQASEKFPVYVSAGDFDKSGGYVPITSLFLPDIHNELKEFPADGRDDILERVPSLRKRYDTYKPFALATMQDIIPPALMNAGQRLKATTLQSCYLRNDGNGKFTLIPLPLEAQFSVVNGMLVDDFDADGNLDVLINGNDYGTSVSIGHLDALNGLLLKGDGKGGFQALSILHSGIYIPGNGKALVKLRTNGGYLVAASQYKGKLKLFKRSLPGKQLPVNADDQYAMIQYANGAVEKRELYHGSSFLSQSARFIDIHDNVNKVTIFNDKQQQRVLQ